MRTKGLTSITSAKGAPIKRVKYATVALIIIVALSALMLNPLWVPKGAAAGTALVTQGNVKGDGGHYLGCLPPDESKVSAASDLPKPTVRVSALPLPSSVDLSGQLPPVGNQGDQNSCAGWATGYYYKSWQEGREHTYPSWDLNEEEYQSSPSFMYNQINIGRFRVMDLGAYLSDAFELLEEKGEVDWTEMPYDWRDYMTQPTEVQLDAAKPYRCSGTKCFWSRLPVVPYVRPNDINLVKSWLNEGKMLVMAIPVYTDFPADYGNLPSPYYDYNGTANWGGGHAVCICGYDDKAKPEGVNEDHQGGFKMVNSWGADWNGDSKGFLYLSYDFVKRYVWEAYANDDLFPDTPSITGLSQDSGDRGETIHVYGKNFGTLRRDAKVEYNGANVTPLSFTNDDIAVTVPENATSGPVTVYDWEGTESNSVPFTITDGVKPNLNAWVTNGPVYSTVTKGNTTYIGGDFTRVVPNTGGGACLDASTGQCLPDSENVNGSVYTSVPDGSGGFYIGGKFNEVGGVPRKNIAHILPDRTLDPSWDPNAGGPVDALAVSGSTVYAGGLFTSVGGEARNNIAAIDADPLSPTYGKATPWDPNANCTVAALAVSGSTVYAGGIFTSIGGQDRERIAAINADPSSQDYGKTIIDWNPSADDWVFALAVSGSTVYAGGNFTSIGGQDRECIAAINADPSSQDYGKTIIDWNPNANNDVYALAVSGSTVYAGGYFTRIGGQARNRIAAIDAEPSSPDYGKATPWNPNANNYVAALAVSGSTVYAGGYFTSIGGQDRNYIAAIDTLGAPTSWDPNANKFVAALAVSGSTVYAGGLFTSVGSAARNNIAAIDATTGAATPWDPDANGTVNALVVRNTGVGPMVYAGGEFTTMKGQARNHIAAIKASGALDDNWDTNANGTVRALAEDPWGYTVIAGGDFTNIGDVPRNHIAAIKVYQSTGYGKATPWNPNAEGGPVNALAVRGSTVYVGGEFTRVGDQLRNHIAALDAYIFSPTYGKLASWNPNANGTVYALAIGRTAVYAGGDFTTIGYMERKHIAAIKSSGAPTAWAPDANDTVRALAVSDPTARDATVYAGGDFTSIGGREKNHIAALKDTGSKTFWNPTATFWNPNANDAVCALAVSGSTVYVGGSFTSPVSCFAAIADNYPDIARISPTRSRNNVAEKRIRLKGAGFLPGATVKLKLKGQPDIIATSVTVDSPERITCYFDLRGAAPGYRDVYMENPGGWPGALPGGFRIL